MSRSKVYVSSTYSDLIEYRRRVYDQLRSMGYDVIAMEDYVATDQRPLDKCLQDVADSDIYLGIIGWRYGFIPVDQVRSITELEYRQAVASNKVKLIFLVDEAKDWPESMIEQGPGAEKLRELRNHLQTEYVTSFFTSPDQLALSVSAAIHMHTQKGIEDGISDLREQRTDDAAERASGRQERVVNLPPVEVPLFRDRLRQQEELRDFLNNRSIRLVNTVGRGGVGKSALVAHVLAAPKPEPKIDESVTGFALDGLMYLSSRTTGLGLDRIYADGARIIGEENSAALASSWARKDLTLQQKAEALIESLRSGEHLILLDGLETTLGHDRSISDEGLKFFVEACLRRDVGPRLLVTSRTDPLVPPDALGATRTIRLSEGLDREDAVQLLRDLDPQGELGLRDASDELLAEAVDQTDGIPRALELVAGILHQDPGASLQRLLEEEPTLRSQTVENMVAEGYQRLEEDSQKVMQVMAVFARPVNEIAITYVLDHWFPGIDVRDCLATLTASYFASSSRQTGQYSLQPMDCDHAYVQIPTGGSSIEPDNEYSRQALELRAADFYATLRRPSVQWRSLEDVEPQIDEFRHSLRGGAIDRALEVLALIDQEYLFLWGHYPLLIELRTSVLDLPARSDLQADNLESLALCNQVIGESDTAIDYYAKAIEVGRETGDSGAQGRRKGNLGRLYRNLGFLEKAEEYTEEALRVARSVLDRREEAFWADRLGLVYRTAGRLEEAIELHRKALEIAEGVGDRRGVGASSSNLGMALLESGDVLEARRLFTEALAIATDINDLRGRVIRLGRLGRTFYDDGDYKAALARHTEALPIARESGDRREESYQLLGIGKALLAENQLGHSESRLRAARKLDIPETSHLAAVATGLCLVIGHKPATARLEFEDALNIGREMLQRSGRLYSVRYSRAMALLGHAVTDPGWDAEAPDTLLAPVMEEYREAMNTCSGKGVVRSSLRDLIQLRSADIGGFDAVIELHKSVLS